MDFGSTFTKAALVDVQAGRLLARAEHPTTIGTDILDGFGVASTSVKGLSITLPSVSIPTALALPGAADLPALDGITQVAGLLTSAPIKLDLATLSSNARFAPGVTAAPGTGTPGTGTPGTGTPGTPAPQLPTTGASAALAALGVALMAGAIVARRRNESRHPVLS